MIHWSQSCTDAASDSMDVQIFRSRIKKNIVRNCDWRVVWLFREYISAQYLESAAVI